MKAKQTIIVDQKEEDKIVTISGSISSYVDSSYFLTTVGEDPTNKNFITYAVNYHCVRADWILNDKEGIIFMKELLRQKRKDLFNTMYIQMITAFLYKRYSKKIMKMMLPSYLIHMFAIFAYLAVSEWLRDNPITTLIDPNEIKYYQNMESGRTVLVLIIIIVILMNFYIFM